jgi:hypothetical protein
MRTADAFVILYSLADAFKVSDAHFNDGEGSKGGRRRQRFKAR